MNAKNPASLGIDIQRARRRVEELAALLGSQVSQNEQVVLNDRYYPFRIPLSTRAFKFDLFVSDRLHAVAAMHRRKTAALRTETQFCVSFKRPSPHMFAATPVSGVARKLGVPVFTQAWTDIEMVESILLAPTVLERLRKARVASLTELFLSPIQLKASSRLRCAASIAQEALDLRDLVISVLGESRGYAG